MVDEKAAVPIRVQLARLVERALVDELDQEAFEREWPAGIENVPFLNAVRQDIQSALEHWPLESSLGLLEIDLVLLNRTESDALLLSCRDSILRQGYDSDMDLDYSVRRFLEMAQAKPDP